MLEKAAALYITNKAFTLAAPLMDKVATPKLHILYARAKEAEGQFREAVASYDAAKDYDNVARLCLGELNDPQRAFAVVRRSRSQDGAAGGGGDGVGGGVGQTGWSALWRLARLGGRHNLRSISLIRDSHAAALSPVLLSFFSSDAFLHAGALTIARFCQKGGDNRTAIEFLVLVRVPCSEGKTQKARNASWTSARVGCCRVGSSR